MAKLYSQAEWARIQSRLPQEDRVPYSESPDRPAGPSAIARNESGTIGAVSAARNMPAPTPMDITSQRYTVAAQAAGLTPTVATSPSAVSTSSDDLYNLKRRVGYGIDEQGNAISSTKVSGPKVQGLPEGFTSGPFPKELEKFFGAPGDILGYRINTETDKDGNTFFTLSVANRGGYGEGVTGYSTFGARFTRDASGNYVPYSGPGTKQDSSTVSTNQNNNLSATAAANLAAQQAAQAAAEEKRRQGASAYALLFSEFERYGLGALVEPLKGFIVEGLSPAEFTLRLRDTDAYRKRFAANQGRISKGLRALSEAEYIGLEDQYQDVMRRYGLPETYYTRGDMGRQEGFEKFISGDVSPVELEDRIQTAQRRVINAAPEVTASLRSFYPEIGQGDLLAYFLDPEKAIENIKRKVTAAEIGGAATMAGLTTGMARAEELGRFGVTGEQARQGFQTIADILPRGSQLAEIYKQSPYTQTTAEQEVFGLTGATEASKRRRQLTQLEQAAFSGQAGAAGGALGRERAGAF
jgi:hypothetical protein